jgi:hypothetical protein
VWVGSLDCLLSEDIVLALKANNASFGLNTLKEHVEATFSAEIAAKKRSRKGFLLLG